MRRELSRQDVVIAKVCRRYVAAPGGGLLRWKKFDVHGEVEARDID